MSVAAGDDKTINQGVNYNSAASSAAAAGLGEPRKKKGFTEALAGISI